MILTNERPGWCLPATGPGPGSWHSLALPLVHHHHHPVKYGEAIDGQDLILLTVCSPAERDLM